jgi:hypothetical protein
MCRENEFKLKITRRGVTSAMCNERKQPLLFLTTDKAEDKIVGSKKV